ncbi:hypothetical protein [Maribacter arcticus]|uniref:hypothetical protein n=1 Tax=Maribacter arcticus TaxID=561365 RepID=UPI003003016C
MDVQKRIDGYFEKMTDFINKLPLTDKGRNYIWFDSFCKFYDELVLSEDGSTTYGIQTEWQLQKFIEQFKNNLKNLRLKAVEKWTDEINNIEPSEAVGKINKHLYQIKKKELLADIGGENLSDWQNWFKKYLFNEMDYHKNRPVKKQIKQQKRTSYVWQNNPDKELPELYKLMVNKYKLIASDTTIEQFKVIFAGKPIETINPIKWHQDNASELLYFIDRLEQSNNIVYNSKRADYQKLKACFVKPDGKQFNVVWKSLKTNIEINLSPEKQKAIDELISNF